MASLGEIWAIPFPYAEKPHFKTRPVLIVGASPMGQQEEEVILVAMITSQVAGQRNGDVPILNTGAAGLSKPSIIKARRLYSASPRRFRTNGANKVGELDTQTFNNVLSEIAVLFSPSP